MTIWPIHHGLARTIATERRTALISIAFSPN